MKIFILTLLTSLTLMFPLTATASPDIEESTMAVIDDDDSLPGDATEIDLPGDDDGPDHDSDDDSNHDSDDSEDSSDSEDDIDEVDDVDEVDEVDERDEVEEAEGQEDLDQAPAAGQ